MIQEHQQKKALVMIVDDEEDSLSVFSTSLKRDGYNVHAFSDPVTALEHFRYSPNECQLIISDVRMPGLSGFQLARKVKEINPKVKVVLTSAFEINPSEFESVLPDVPVDGFLDKPLSLKQLAETVEKQLATE
ncbi:MAG: response regulator [Nitrososphaera sp.]|jgi:DNA-binding NtrC family response regulator